MTKSENIFFIKQFKAFIMMHKSKNKLKNFNKTCWLLTDEGPSMASSDPTESCLTK